MKVVPPEAVEKIPEKPEQNGQKDGRALETVACGAHGQGGVLWGIEDFHLVARFAGRVFRL